MVGCFCTRLAQEPIFFNFRSYGGKQLDVSHNCVQGETLVFKVHTEKFQYSPLHFRKQILSLGGWPTGNAASNDSHSNFIQKHVKDDMYRTMQDEISQISVSQ